MKASQGTAFLHGFSFYACPALNSFSDRLWPLLCKTNKAPVSHLVFGVLC